MPFISYSPSYLDWILFKLLHPVEQGCYVVIDGGETTCESLSRAFYDQGWNGIRIHQYEQTQLEKITTLSREQHFLIPGLNTNNATALRTFLGQCHDIHLLITCSLTDLEKSIELVKAISLRPRLIVAQKSVLGSEIVSSNLITALENLGYEFIEIENEAFLFIAKEQAQLIEKIKKSINIWSFSNLPFISHEIIDLRIQLRYAEYRYQLNQKALTEKFNQSQAHLNQALITLDDSLICHKSFSQLLKALMIRIMTKLRKKSYLLNRNQVSNSQIHAIESQQSHKKIIKIEINRAESNLRKFDSEITK